MSNRSLLNAALLAVFFVACSGVASGPPPGGNRVAAQPARDAKAPVVVGATDFRYQFRDVARDVGPAVVSISATKLVHSASGSRGSGGSPFDFFFRGPGADRRGGGGRGEPPQHKRHKQQGVGSGVIVDARGYVLTNNHVVRQADALTVTLSDERELPAEIVGVDPKTDLAVIKIDAEGLQPVAFGDSDRLEVGEWVMAIGSPFGLKQTVSAGIVSAVGRGNMGIADYEDFIQTDAAINPGNSGGPLVTLEGKLVGVNTAIASRSGGNQGIGFSIPINMARDVMDQLIGGGQVVRGYLGAYIADAGPKLSRSFGYEGKGGVLIQDVGKGGPGATAGLRAGDIVIERDGKPVDDMVGFRNGIARSKPGTATALTVWRDGKRSKLKVTLGELPGEPRAAGKRGGAAGGPDVSALGLGLADATPKLQRRFELSDDVGAVVVQVSPGSAAAEAGLRPGDLIERVGGKAVASAAAAQKAIAAGNLASGVRLRIVRDGRGMFVMLNKL